MTEAEALKLLHQYLPADQLSAVLEALALHKPTNYNYDNIDPHLKPDEMISRWRALESIWMAYKRVGIAASSDAYIEMDLYKCHYSF